MDELLKASETFIKFLEKDSLECHACWEPWHRHTQDCPFVEFKKAVKTARKLVSKPIDKSSKV